MSEYDVEIDDNVKFGLYKHSNEKLFNDQKHCFKCKTIKSLNYFGNRKKSPDGKHPYCKECCKKYSHDYNKKNGIKYLDKKKIWYENNKEKAKESYKNRYIVNKEEISKYKKENRHIIREYERTIPKYKLNAKAAKRRAAIRKAIPKWANLDKINKIYKKASELNLTVDHIIPLQSSIVCGLHVQNNLRFITHSENATKGNRIWPDMPT